MSIPTSRIAAIAIAVLGSASAVAQKLPNIIIIYADDLGYGDLSSYNAKAAYKTPRLDQMAKEARSAPMIDLEPAKKILREAGKSVLDKLDIVGAAGAKKLAGAWEALKRTRFDPSE